MPFRDPVILSVVSVIVKVGVCRDVFVVPILIGPALPAGFPVQQIDQEGA